MSLSYCVVPHYDHEEPTKVAGWCVMERSSHRDQTIGCYGTKEQAEQVRDRLKSNQVGNNVA